MDFKANQKYFKGKFANTFSILSIILIILGILIGLYAMVMYSSFALGVPLLIAGIILFMVSASFIITDHDYDNNGLMLASDFQKDFVLTNPILGSTNKAKIASDHTDPVYFDEYYFEGGDFFLHEGKDKKYRSSKYFTTAFLVEPDKLYVSFKLHSLVNEYSEVFTESYDYSQLSGAEFREIEHELLNKIVRYKHMVLLDKDEKEVLTIPVTEDASSDTVHERVNLYIRRARTE